MSYFDVDLNETWEDRAVRESTHKFAAEVMRPIAKELDRMSAEEAAAPGSPLHDFFKEAYRLGYHKAMFPAEVGGAGFTTRQKCIFAEELAWGSMGLATSLETAMFPFLFPLLVGNQAVIEKFTLPYMACEDGSMRGCWGITEPNRGGDMGAIYEEFYHRPGIKADVRARVDGDEVVINGQKSAWVTNGTIATHSMVHLQLDPSLGLAGSGVCLVPLDLPGVTRGKALEKVGQRDLNQGEIYFDEVRVPLAWMLAGPGQYLEVAKGILAIANMSMGLMCTGLARAAFDEALAWSKERVQGGRAIVEHRSMRQRLFKMFSRVETSRALARAAAGLVQPGVGPYPEYSVAAKTTCSELCYQNADDAVQIFGASGLSREYTAERLFRDARATLIEDGNNETLAALAGAIVAESYPRVR